MAKSDDEVDIYADDLYPISRHYCTIYRVHPAAPYNEQIDIYVRVYESDGLANLESYKWFGKTGPKHGGYRLSDPKDKEIWDRNKEVYEWLSEWGFIELKRIGPEDSEWFATDKLTKEGNDNDTH